MYRVDIVYTRVDHIYKGCEFMYILKGAVRVENFELLTLHEMPGPIFSVTLGQTSTTAAAAQLKQTLSSVHWVCARARAHRRRKCAAIKIYAINFKHIKIKEVLVGNILHQNVFKAC